MNPEDLLARGQDRARSEQWLAALDAFLDLTWTEAEASTWNDRGLLHYLLREEDLAEECFSRGLAQDPGHFLTRANAFYLAEAKRVKAAAVPDFRGLIQYRKSRGETEPPRVSVIMPTYNRAGLIRESLESVLHQTFPHFELLVINDGGDQEVESVLEAFTDSRLRYAYAEHGGLSQALNVGVAEARGQYLAFLDDDDVYYPDHLESLVAAAESLPEPTVVYTDSYQAFQRRQGDHYRTARRELRSAGGEAGERLAETNPIPVLALLLPRAGLDRVGGFRVPLQMGMDWDLLLRLADAFPFQHVAKATCEFRTRDDATQITGTLKPDKNYWDNLVLYLNRRLKLFSFPEDPAAQGRYTQALAFLREMAGQGEESLSAFSLRELWRMQKPHRYFCDQGAKHLAAGRGELARRMFGSALRLNFWEPKAWQGWWRAR